MDGQGWVVGRSQRTWEATVTIVAVDRIILAASWRHFLVEFDFQRERKT